MQMMDEFDNSRKDNYVSSSDEDNVSGDDRSSSDTRSKARPPMVRGDPPTRSGAKTGPKGVIRDYEHYKELREQEEAWKTQQHQKRQSSKQQPVQPIKQGRDEVPVLESDPFLQEYKEKRIREMQAAAAKSGQKEKRFGSLIHVSASTFLSAVDNESSSVYVVVHIYDESVDGCSALNGCLTCLASQYTQTKFCRLLASDAPVSHHFKSDGLPALLVYRGGQLIGNFIRVCDQLGDDFYASDVEKFLVDHECLPIVDHA